MTLAQRYTGSDTPLIGKQSVAAAHLQATAYAADLPFGNGLVNLGGVAGATGPKTLIFDVLGFGRPQQLVLSRSALFLLSLRST